jgi:hypothetical protein
MRPRVRAISVTGAGGKMMESGVRVHFCEKVGELNGL